jgi:hypothetical protein
MNSSLFTYNLSGARANNEDQSMVMNFGSGGDKAQAP